MTQKEKDLIEKRASEWFEKLVPQSGLAPTKGGEIMRAAMRLLYRYYNDGDIVSEGYGLTTCWSSGRFLVDTAPSSISTVAEDLWKYDAGRYDENDEYDNQLHLLMAMVCDYLDTDEKDSQQPNAWSCIDWAAAYSPEERYDDDDEY